MKQTAGLCCSSAGQLSVAVRQSERDMEDSCHPGSRPQAWAGTGRPAPREKAGATAKGSRAPSPALGGRVRAGGWPHGARGLGCRERVAPRRGEGWRNTGKGLNGRGTLATLSPSPLPSLPSHLLLDLGTVGEGVFTAVVDSHIAGWEGGVERVKGGPGGAGGDAPTCRHPSPPGHAVSETPLFPDLSATTTPVPPLPSASAFLPAGNRVRGRRGPA